MIQLARIISAYRKPLFVVLLASLAATTFATSPVNLGTAGNFSILAETLISTTGTTAIVGDIGISPAAASFITGFTLSAPPTTFTTSPLVTGKVYAADYDPPTPSNMGIAIGDSRIAFTDAAGRATTNVTDFAGGLIGGQTFAPGVWKWGGNVLIRTTEGNVTLSGSATDVWIFQIAGNLTVDSAGSLATGLKIVLLGEAKAANVFWQVDGGAGATLGTYATFKGNILASKQIVLQTGAVLNGRALSQTQVTLNANTVTGPAYSGPNPPTPGKAFAYPSPANGGVINIVYNMVEAGKAVIRIWNENGDLVATVDDKKSSGPQEVQIPISTFARGVYIYRVLLTYDSGRVEKIAAKKFAVTK